MSVADFERAAGGGDYVEAARGELEAFAGGESSVGHETSVGGIDRDARIGAGKHKTSALKPHGGAVGYGFTDSVAGKYVFFYEILESVPVVGVAVSLGAADGYIYRAVILVDAQESLGVYVGRGGVRGIDGSEVAGAVEGMVADFPERGAEVKYGKSVATLECISADSLYCVRNGNTLNLGHM